MCCHDFQALQCSCAGCCSLDPPAPPPPPPVHPPSAPPRPPPPAPPPIPEAWPVACGQTCRLRTCKAWLEFGGVTCSEIGNFCGAEGACDGCCIHDPPAPPSPAAPGEEAPRPPGEYNMVAVITLSATAGALVIVLLILLLRRCVRRARARLERARLGPLDPAESTIQLSPHSTHFSDDNLEALGAYHERPRRPSFAEKSR